MAKKVSDLQKRLEDAYGGTSGQSVLSFDACDASDLHNFVVSAVRAGALVSFSRTRDGGAVVLTILHDELEGGRFKDYFGHDQAVAEVISMMSAFWGE